MAALARRLGLALAAGTNGPQNGDNALGAFRANFAVRGKKPFQRLQHSHKQTQKKEKHRRNGAGLNPTQKRVIKSISFSTAAKLPARFRKQREREREIFMETQKRDRGWRRNYNRVTSRRREKGNTEKTEGAKTPLRKEL